MVNLADFMTERLKYDADLAERAGGGWWERRDGGLLVSTDNSAPVATFAEQWPREHAIEHAPSHVLIDCDAKVRIVDQFLHVSALAATAEDPVDRARLDGLRDGLEAAIRLLAQNYAGHPDYDNAWRP